MRAGRFFVHGAHDRDKRRVGDLAIEIEAGLAFGTGHHGTTAGCLEMIDEVVRREQPRNALDLGTGSAVLAIALAKLAHIPVLATDIDPVATRVAAENVRLNQVSRLCRDGDRAGLPPSGLPAARAPFDLIVANILARPLMRLAPEMAAHRHAGRLADPVRHPRAPARRRASRPMSAQKFRHVRTLQREGWVTLHLKR